MMSWFLLWLALTALGVEVLTLRGLAGLAGTAALVGFFMMQPLTAAEPTIIVLLVAGLIGMLLELHLLPGHGISGVLGIGALSVAIALSYGPNALIAGLETFLCAALLAVLTVIGIARFVPGNAWKRRLVFTGAQGADYVASDDHRALLGCEGVARSMLRPAGVAEIGGQRVDVLTAGDFIGAGSPVRVTRVEGARIFVDAITAPTRS